MCSIDLQYALTGTTTGTTHSDQVFVHGRQSKRVELRERRGMHLYSIGQAIIVDLLGGCEHSPKQNIASLSLGCLSPTQRYFPSRGWSIWEGFTALAKWN